MMHAWTSPSKNNVDGGAIYMQGDKMVMVTMVSDNYFTGHNYVQKNYAQRYPDIHYIGVVGEFVQPNPLLQPLLDDCYDPFDYYMEDDDYDDDPYDDHFEDDYDDYDLDDPIWDEYYEEQADMAEVLMPDETDKLYDKLEGKR